jgi:phasin family protein
MAQTAAKKTVKITKTVAAPAKKIVRRKNIAASAAALATKTLSEEGFAKMTDAVKNTAAQAAEKATDMFKDMQARMQGAFGNTSEMTKDVVEFSKANLEAVVESTKLAATGAQTAAKHTAELTRKNWDASSAHLKALAAVKSPTDFFKLQGDFARSQFDAAVAEVSKSSEFYLKLAGEVSAPVQNRVAVIVDQVKARVAV